MIRNNVVYSRLGELKILEVFEDYDGPKLFSCESLSGHKYIVLWIDSTNDFDRWFYLPISNSRLESVRQGIITLFECFSEPEDRWLWEVKTYHVNNKEENKQIGIGEISEEDLPDREAVLNLKARRLSELTDTPLDEAERSRREVVDLALNLNEAHSTEIESDQLGLVLHRFQSLVRSLGHKSDTVKGRIPKKIEDGNTLMVVGFYAASFGVRLESKYNANLFNYTEMTSSLGMLMDLIEAKDDRQNLLNVLEQLSPKSIARYRFLLKVLRDGNMAMRLQWANPLKTDRQVGISIKEVYSVLELLKEEGKDVSEIYTLDGTLVGLSKTRKSFEFQTFDGDKFAGILSEELLKRQFKIQSDVRVSIEETLELSPLTQEERITYKLIDVVEFDDILRQSHNGNNDQEQN